MTDSPSEDEAGVGGDEPYSTTERIPTEARAKWTYFILGCAILLPWNGDIFRQTTHIICAHVYSAMANATPFFLSRLAGSTFYPTFSSYLSSVYTLTKLACQFYCTFTSKQVGRFYYLVIISERSRIAVVSISPHIHVHHCDDPPCHISVSQHVHSRHTIEFFCICSIQCSLFGSRDWISVYTCLRWGGITWRVIPANCVFGPSCHRGCSQHCTGCQLDHCSLGLVSEIRFD